MFKSRFVMAALAAASLSIAGSALAQSPTSPEPPPAAPAPQHAPSCAQAVHKAEDNIFLRIQQYTGAENRATAEVHLDLAMAAAANGNEAKCWAELRLSKQYVN